MSNTIRSTLLRATRSQALPSRVQMNPTGLQYLQPIRGQINLPLVLARNQSTLVGQIKADIQQEVASTKEAVSKSTMASDIVGPLSSFYPSSLILIVSGSASALCCTRLHSEDCNCLFQHLHWALERLDSCPMLLPRL